MGGQRHAPAALSKGNKSRTHSTGGWAVLEGHLDGHGKSCPRRGSNPGPSSPPLAIRLCYPKKRQYRGKPQQDTCTQGRLVVNSIPGSDAVWFGRWVPIPRRKPLLPSSEQNSHSISKMESVTVPPIYTYAYLSTKPYDVTFHKTVTLISTFEQINLPNLEQEW